jgi:hypothetical protein
MINPEPSSSNIIVYAVGGEFSASISNSSMGWQDALF